MKQPRGYGFSVATGVSLLCRITQAEPPEILKAGNSRKQKMATGTVKWFNDKKGFGFLTQDGGGEDVFCHHTAIIAEGFRTLTEGQKVSFEVSRGPKGLQASNVQPIA